LGFIRKSLDIYLPCVWVVVGALHGYPGIYHEQEMHVWHCLDVSGTCGVDFVGVFEVHETDM